MSRLVGWFAVAALLLLAASNYCKAQGIARLGVGVQPGAMVDSVPVHSLSPKDTFLGPDKVKHFFMSAFVESLGFGGMEATGASRNASIATATVVTAAAGIGREIHDKITKNLFSFGDLAWDAIGAGAALVMISHTQR